MIHNGISAMMYICLKLYTLSPATFSRLLKLYMYYLLVIFIIL